MAYVKTNINARAVKGWSVDASAIRDACELLGIRGTVNVRIQNNLRKSYGKTIYRVKTGRDKSRAEAWRTPIDDIVPTITLSGLADAAKIRDTIWHELTHVKQSQDFATLRDWISAYNRAGGKGYGYQMNRYEIEARAMGSKYADIPLIRETY